MNIIFTRHVSLICGRILPFFSICTQKSVRTSRKTLSDGTSLNDHRILRIVRCLASEMLNPVDIVIPKIIKPKAILLRRP